MSQEKRYSPDEVTAIVANALRRRRERGDISHEELLETAAEMGIPPADVEEAARYLATERDLEEAKKKWIERQRRGYRYHLVAFVIVNVFLFLVDILTSGGVWFYWPLLGWGIGLAFHTYFVFFPDPEQIEEGARRLLAAQRFGAPE